LFVMGVWWWWRKGIGAYYVDDEEREEWYDESLIAERKNGLLLTVGWSEKDMRDCECGTPQLQYNTPATVAHCRRH